MGVSIEQYRQRIGCFARVATILSSLKVRRYKRATSPQQSKDFGISPRVIIRLSCLVILVAAVIPSSSFVLDLTQFDDVEKNPGPNPEQKYKFHSISYCEFEKLAVDVLKDIYKVPFSTFKEGKDGGRDAVAQRVDIRLGRGHILMNQNVIVQVKHTSIESAQLTDGKRNSVFQKGEEENVKKLVKDKELDIYIIVTNYKLPAGQSVALQNFFKNAGAKEVFVLGYEKLSDQLNDSLQLLNKVFLQYPTVVPQTDHLLNYVRELRSVQQLEESTTVDSNSTSKSCESPPPKRQRLETNDNGDNIKALKGILCHEYNDRAFCIHPLPWMKTPRFELSTIFTRLDIIRKENTRSQPTKETVELSDIFDKHKYTKREDPIRTVLIEGSPGMGKTMLSIKIAHDWAMGKMPSKFPRIQLVLLIKCRDMEGDILKAINEQLFPWNEDSLKKKLLTFIEKQPEKILLIVDGLDEISEAATEHVIQQLLTTQCLFRKCYIVVTSRQERGLKVRQYFDALLEIKGYSQSDIEEYVTRYFQDSDPSLAKRLIENLETDINIRTLAINPLNTVLLCVVFEEYRGKLPSTVTELYYYIVCCITKRYCEKYSLKMEVEDKILETSKEELGRLSYQGLLKNALFFRESDLNDDCTTKSHCINMGFLSKEDSKNIIKQDHTYWFLHKTFQEYFSAFYLTEKVKSEERIVVGDMIDQLKDTKRFMQVLKFVSGILHKKYAVHHRAVVETLGTVLSQSMDKEKVLDILCEVLSESPVNKDMADIIHQFLPKHFFFMGLHHSDIQYHEDAHRILPRILNLLCTKDGVNKEVYIDYICYREAEIFISELRLICEALMEKLKVEELVFESICVIDDIRREHIDDFTFTAEATELLEKVLRKNCNLKKLHFDGVSLTNVGDIIATLKPDTSSTDMPAGRRGSVLHTLVLNHAKCDEQSALAAADMLRTNKTLKKLDMSLNQLGSKGATHIADALKSNRTLNCLCLSFTSGSDDGAVALAAMLHSNETLTELFLCGFKSGNGYPNSEFGNDVAVAFAKALRANKSLKELHLCDNVFTDEGFKCLAEALLHNTALEKLCIDHRDDGNQPSTIDDDLKALDQHTREKIKERLHFDCSCHEDM